MDTTYGTFAAQITKNNTNTNSHLRPPKRVPVARIRHSAEVDTCSLNAKTSLRETMRLRMNHLASLLQINNSKTSYERTLTLALEELEMYKALLEQETITRPVIAGCKIYADVANLDDESKFCSS